jgi:hypothetical protein
MVVGAAGDATHVLYKYMCHSCNNSLEAVLVVHSYVP